MKKKCYILALCSFLTGLAIFVFTYFLYHYLGPDCHFGTVFQCEPTKPFVTLLFGIWGTAHQFAAVTCLLIGRIFFGEDGSSTGTV